MVKDNRYELAFLFDASQVTRDDLKKRARALLQKHLAKVVLDVKSVEPGGVQLSITGPLEDVDACHDKLNAELSGRYSCVRVLDEAGDDIRQRAYPILARIEQGLRTFINRAMTEVIGFDWWDRMTPPALRTSVEDMERKAGNASEIHHPLELTYFDQLVDMVTGSVQEWEADRKLSVADLAELLSDCGSIEEVHRKLAGRTRKISLWDEVFARYFEQKDEWSQLDRQLHKSVIPARNKVMHHRPIRLYELQELSNIQRSIRTLLSSAKAELPREERAEARHVGVDFIDVMRRQQEEWAHAQWAFLEPIRLQQALLAQLQRAMLEPIRQQETQWPQVQRAVLEPIRQQQALLAQLQRAMLDPFRRLQEQMALPLEGLVKPPLSEADAREEESRLTYRVYENWAVRPDKAIIHRSDCPYANGGPVRPPTRNGRWHGPFPTIHQALEAARRTGRTEVRGCKYCSPTAP
jgi:hypothetical protein